MAKKLYILLINSSPYDSSVDYTGTYPAGLAPYQWYEEGSQPGNYQDFHTLTNLDTYWEKIPCDYKFKRERLKEMRDLLSGADATERWNNATLAEKRILLKYSASGINAEYNNGETIATDAEQIEWDKEFRRQMQAARIQRDEAVAVKIIQKIRTGAVPMTFISDIENEISELRLKYRIDGFEGKDFGDAHSYLFDFLYNTNDFTFQTVIGVNQGAKTFTIEGDHTSTNYDRVKLGYKVISPKSKFIIVDSTGNDGTYTVSSATFDNTNTIITVIETIPSAVADGILYYAGLLSYESASAALRDELIDIWVNGNY